MKKLFILFILSILPINSYALIEVDITRGNLDPLPVAVSPLSIDENSKKQFKDMLNKENIGEDISKVVENNLRISGLFNP
ncbi:MAG: Tol-Pal system protein TolB, partial [Pelagibacteraceae bacterium]